MENFWDKRYNTTEYVYGREPNAWFRAQLNKLKPGRILLPGEGEGRNAVYAASKGWKTHAFDTSVVGREKARQLAWENGTSIEYSIASYLDFNPGQSRYDVTGLMFTHQPPEMRSRFHAQVVEWILPGGALILEGFHKDQIYRDSGGPGNLGFLFSEQELRKDFIGLEIIELKTVVRNLDEGSFHQGEAAVIQLFAKKPET